MHSNDLATCIVGQGVPVQHGIGVRYPCLRANTVLTIGVIVEGAAELGRLTYLDLTTIKLCQAIFEIVRVFEYLSENIGYVMQKTSRRIVAIHFDFVHAATA